MTRLNQSDRVSPYRPNPFPQPQDPNNHTLQIIAIGPRTIIDHYMIRQHQLGYAVRVAFPKEIPKE
ncbi:MAG: hypothetical protein WBA10_14000 [Elainellaceae cyanobacterium]